MNEQPIWGDQNAVSKLLELAKSFSLEYIDSLPTREVYPAPTSIEKLQELDEAFPEGSSDPRAVLETLNHIGNHGVVAQTSGRYFGFVNGGTLPIGLSSRWLADTWDQNTAHYVMSPLNSHLEKIVERWLVQLLRFPVGTAAGFVTGTTLANFSGLCAARNEILKNLDWDVVKKGLGGAPNFRILVGQGAHAAVYKSMSMLGLGTERIEVIPQDRHGRLDPTKIPVLSEPALVVAQVGNVNSGAIDPVGEICDRVAGTGSWVHVDGAFGLWGRAVPGLNNHFEGLEKADSWSVDAHKTLNVPYDSGIILCKNRNALIDAFRASASYFQWNDEHRDGMSYTPSMSKRARVIELWATLKTLGRSGVVELIEQLCRNAKMIARKLQNQGFEILNEIVFNQVLVSCENDHITTNTIDNVQKSGEIWCGGSNWDGRKVIRLSVCDWATDESDIDRAVAALVRARENARTSTPVVDPGRDQIERLR